jgi:hypothetical protein
MKQGLERWHEAASYRDEYCQAGQRRPAAGPNLEQKVVAVECLIWSSPHVMEIDQQQTEQSFGGHRLVDASSHDMVLQRWSNISDEIRMTAFEGCILATEV